MIACYAVTVNGKPFGRIVNAPSRNAAMELLRLHLHPKDKVILEQTAGKLEMGDDFVMTNCLFKS